MIDEIRTCELKSMIICICFRTLLECPLRRPSVREFQGTKMRVSSRTRPVFGKAEIKEKDISDLGLRKTRTHSTTEGEKVKVHNKATEPEGMNNYTGFGAVFMRHADCRREEEENVLGARLARRKRDDFFALNMFAWRIPLFTERRKCRGKRTFLRKRPI
ncbi:hypothetical protein BDZ97DRAFT_619415 [Flammula alnicola]|nr:hypothetical protein BDZ97DRAFT_619415 [Flammula alnicola]